MNTKVIKISEDLPPAEITKLHIAVNIIKSGGVVAFPTETVYGLGANGLDETACAKIYEAKGRPSDNPLILHISDMSQLDELAAEISETAKLLADSFWPGPMTLVMKRTSIVPSLVSGGLDTVAIRMPSNRIAHELIKQSGVPIAAPSANVSGRPSSTRSEHVETDLTGQVDMIIDGGSSVYGLESTIVDVSGKGRPCLLRPGSITVEQLESIVGKIDIDPAVTAHMLSGDRPKAPGMAYVHYAPRAELVIVTGNISSVQRKISELAHKQQASGTNASNIAIITTDEGLDFYRNAPAKLFSLGKRSNLDEPAANLYDVLRSLDEAGITHAFAEGFDEVGIGLSIMNRMKKAAGYRILAV